MRRLLLITVCILILSGSAIAFGNNVTRQQGPRFKRGEVYQWAKQEAYRLKLSVGEWSCLSALVSRENANTPDRWDPQRWNGRGSGAYGLPQALPGSKMASEGADWSWNPVTQIRWMIGYSKSRYGGVCQADSFQRSHGYY